MKRICVFAGSNSGARVEYVAAARELGRVLAQRQLGVVYGGARVGLMGALADAALSGELRNSESGPGRWRPECSGSPFSWEGSGLPSGAGSLTERRKNGCGMNRQRH